MYKKYLVLVDGLKVGIIELTNADVNALLSDSSIKVMEV